MLSRISSRVSSPVGLAVRFSAEATAAAGWPSASLWSRSQALHPLIRDQEMLEEWGMSYRARRLGTLTSICCESTARAAYMRDYKVMFVSDANGDIDEDAHEATLRVLPRIFA